MSCLANLSSDEVLAARAGNRMLDLLPTRIWHNKNTTFLDPGCKSRVFLREVAKRLDAGLNTRSHTGTTSEPHPRKQLFGG